MKHSSKIAFLSIFAAVLIVGAASAAYISSGLPFSSKADSQTEVAISPTAQDITKTSDNFKLPEDLTVQETLRISDSVKIVSALSPLEDGVFSTTLSLWRIDSASGTVEKIHEFKSGIPEGLLTTIERGYGRNEYLYTIEEAWEGYRHVERILLQQDGSIAAVILQPSELEFTIKSKGESITVKPYGDLCHNKEVQTTTSQSIVRTLEVNNEGFALKEPYTLNCEISEMQGVHTGTMFTDIEFSSIGYQGNRHAYVNLYGSKQHLDITLEKSGLINISQ